MKLWQRSPELKMGHSRPLFVYFRRYHMAHFKYKSLGVLGTWTWGRQVGRRRRIHSAMAATPTFARVSRCLSFHNIDFSYFDLFIKFKNLFHICTKESEWDKRNEWSKTSSVTRCWNRNRSSFFKSCTKSS